MINTLPEQAKRYALVVGVNDYDDGRISDLGEANRDARALAEALQQHAGFPHQQIFLLTTDQQDRDRKPTRGNILNRLDALVDAVPEDGLLLVSFAGHGLEREEKPFLLPCDVPYTLNVRLLEDMAVSVVRLKEYIKATRVGQVIILLDACRNLPTGRAISPNLLTDSYRRGFEFDVLNHEVQAFATLYATAVGQYALEDIARKRGYFTTAVVEAMAGKAANERGEVTLNALVKYVQEQVPQRVKLMGGHEQKPFAVIEGFKADELVIAAVEPRTVTVAVTQPSETERLFWAAIQNSDDPDDYEEYLTRWPQGDFAGLARRRKEAILRKAEEKLQLLTLDPSPPDPEKPREVVNKDAAPALKPEAISARPHSPPAKPLNVSPVRQPTRSAWQWRRLIISGGVLAMVTLAVALWKAVPSQRYSTIMPQASPTTSDLPLVGDVRVEMVNLPGGTFTMGSSDDGYGDERPLHQVTVGAFAIGKYEVTQAQWQKVIGNNPSQYKGDDLPVEKVSWDDAQAFCRKIGNGYRLPTEAEWEYAARAGSSGKWSFGNDKGRLSEYAWFYGNSGKANTPGRAKEGEWVWPV